MIANAQNDKFGIRHCVWADCVSGDLSRPELWLESGPQLMLAWTSASGYSSVMFFVDGIARIIQPA